MNTEDHIIIYGYRHVLYQGENYSDSEMATRSLSFCNWLDKRRSVRHFSGQPVSKKVIENIIRSASTAPSGANKQPWIFCAVSDEKIKRRIRKAAEAEEKTNYEKRMSEHWKNDLKPIATDMNKPFLEKAPWLIVVFKQVFIQEPVAEKHPNYYVNESVGIACGMLIAAIHNAGLVTVTHTPSPMQFLVNILQRPENERPYLLLPVGYPESPCYVPDINRKGLDEVSVFYE